MSISENKSFANTEEQKTSSPVVLSVKDVKKSFRLPTEQASGLKQAFINWTKGVKGYKTHNVLRDITFDVHQGDFFGIVGRNGSGKSTLLKIISGIYYPNAGSVSVTGKLVPFIELGVGFNPELTGRENVYLNGALLGFTREQIDDMYDDIVDFAELEEFMDQKLKNYSSGMQVRLAFSVAIKAQGDILVLDEVLAVGDEAFQRKCDDYFAEVKNDPSKTVILVTHSMESVKKYCNKAILIKDGNIIVSGDKNDVADQYTLENLEREKKQSTKQAEERHESEFAIGLNERVPLLKVVASSSQVIKNLEPFVFDVEYQFDEELPFFITVTLLDSKRGGIVYDSADQFRMSEKGHRKLRLSLPTDPFTNGEFRIQAQIRTIPDGSDPHKGERIAFTNDANSCDFVIRYPQNDGGYALLSDRALSIERL